MFAPNLFTIRLATEADAAALIRLAALDSQRPLTGRAVVGELDGAPAAAISLEDGRTIADPFRPTASLLAHLRMRAGVVRAYERTPSLTERMRERIWTGSRSPAHAAA